MRHPGAPPRKVNDGLRNWRKRIHRVSNVESGFGLLHLYLLQETLVRARKLMRERAAIQENNPGTLQWGGIECLSLTEREFRVYDFQL